MELLPKCEPIEEVMAIFPLDPLESILEKDVEHFITKEDDLEETLELCETEHPSSPSIKLKPLPSSLQYVILDNNRNSFIIFHNEPLEKENPWAVNKLEVLTLEYERDASI
jgi:hypothetical protein